MECKDEKKEEEEEEEEEENQLASRSVGRQLARAAEDGFHLKKLFDFKI
ncbi:MAG: hypothetical protein ABI763_12545 [Bacteroidota bacterium]